MAEKLKDVSRELDIYKHVAHKLKIDIDEIRISTKSLLQIMETINRQLLADPSNEAIQEQCGPFYEMSREICIKIEELQSDIEGRSEVH